MKSTWLAVSVIAVVTFLPPTQGNSDDADKAPVPTANPQRSNKSGDIRDDNGLKMKLVWCPPGFLTMEQVELINQPAAEKDAESDSKNDNQPSDDDFDPKEEPV